MADLAQPFRNAAFHQAVNGAELAAAYVVDAADQERLDHDLVHTLVERVWINGIRSTASPSYHQPLPRRPPAQPSRSGQDKGEHAPSRRGWKGDGSNGESPHRALNIAGRVYCRAERW